MPLAELSRTADASQERVCSSNQLDSGAPIRSGAADLPTHCWPTNKAAAREMWAPTAEAFTSKKCPPLHPVPTAEIQRRVSKVLRNGEVLEFRDLTGQRNGAMVIVGLRTYRERRRSSWIARCDCGNYEQRNHRNWQKYMRNGVPDACWHCMPEELRRAVVYQFMNATKESNVKLTWPTRRERHNRRNTR